MIFPPPATSDTPVKPPLPSPVSSHSQPTEPVVVAWAPPLYKVEEPFSLPFDPLRVLWGLRRGQRWIFAGALAGLLLGGGIGLLETQTRYQAVIQLLRRSAPPITQTAVNGEPYKPREFTHSTLANVASSPNVLDRVARKAVPPISARQLKESITVEEDKLTDFLTLTLSGYKSPQATVALAKLWSEEIISVTREMQAQETHDIRRGIQTQIDANQAELQSLDEQMTKFPNAGLMLGADTQADSFVKMQDDIDARYNAARLELEGYTSQLAGLQAELLRHTPEAEELRQARADLDAFRARYTDQNPLVQERVAKIAALEAQLKKQAAAPVADVSDIASHSGTLVADQLYLKMVDLQNQRSASELRLQELAKQHELFAKAPETVSQIIELLQRKQMLRATQALLLGRLQEVRIYEDNAPSYYGIFDPADVDRVMVTTKAFQVTLLSVGGALCGTLFALGLVLLAVLADRKLRTPNEAAKAAGAPVIASLAAGDALSARSGAKLWMRWLGSTRGDTHRLRTVWCPTNDAAEEKFWQTILVQARALLPGLIVIDGGEPPSAALAALPAASHLDRWEKKPPFSVIRCPMLGMQLPQITELHYFIENRVAEGIEVWLRLTGPVQEPAAGIVSSVASTPLLLAPLNAGATAAFLHEQADLLRHIGAPPCGVVALNDLSLASAV
jgi:capsular polysaccharide biosynthesis protein